MTADPQAAEQPTMHEFAIELARLLADRRCDDVVLMDVRNLSQVTDYVLVATGTSDRQMRSVADELKGQGRESGHLAFTNERDTASTWLVVDFVELIVHLFEPSQRAYYDLESLWGDAERVDWSRADGDPATDG
ncbi:MAG: ribosome silencing factor [Phycisphaerales bacterium]